MCVRVCMRMCMRVRTSDSDDVRMRERVTFRKSIQV